MKKKHKRMLKTMKADMEVAYASLAERLAALAESVRKMEAKNVVWNSMPQKYNKP